jgi:hypothetical protein
MLTVVVVVRARSVVIFLAQAKLQQQVMVVTVYRPQLQVHL